MKRGIKFGILVSWIALVGLETRNSKIARPAPTPNSEFQVRVSAFRETKPKQSQWT